MDTAPDLIHGDDFRCTKAPLSLMVGDVRSSHLIQAMVLPGKAWELGEPFDVRKSLRRHSCVGVSEQELPVTILKGEYSAYLSNT